MKDESKIPRGPYCYNTLKVDPNNGKMKIKLCPYWSKTGDIGKCSFLGISDEDYASSLLWDQVKECGINNDDEFIEKDLH
jgi:hypothetical protein